MHATDECQRLSQAVMGRDSLGAADGRIQQLTVPHPLRPLALGKHQENDLNYAERVERAALPARFRKHPRYSFEACFRIRAGIFVAFDGSAYGS